MDGRLLKELETRGIATSSAGWVTMPPRIAQLYVMVLAVVAGKDLDAPVLADEDDGQLAEHFFALREACEACGAPASQCPLDGFAWAQQLATFPTSKRLEGVPAAAVLRWRERHTIERHEFRCAVQERLTAVASLASPNAIRSQMGALAEEINAAIDETRRSRRKCTLREFSAAIGVGMPAALGAAAAVAGSPWLVAGFGGVGSVALGAMYWAVHRRPAKERFGWRAYEYLLSLDDEPALRESRACAKERVHLAEQHG
jgi:hypothetical protein